MLSSSETVCSELLQNYFCHFLFNTVNSHLVLKLLNQLITRISRRKWWLGPQEFDLTEWESFARLETPHLCLLAVEDNRWSSQQELQLISKSTCRLVIAFPPPCRVCECMCVCEVELNLTASKFSQTHLVIRHVSNIPSFNLVCYNSRDRTAV